jgi:hypothetical protein
MFSVVFSALSVCSITTTRRAITGIRKMADE